ncbi:MAG: thiolase domain-containing protein [Micromonosporaceae bacterium]
MSTAPREVGVVAFAQTKHSGADTGISETEMLQPVIGDALTQAGLRRAEIGFTCSGSCDYLAGAPFSFVSALDAVGAWPPISESHVEMDGAWALYEAWVRLQHGDIDTALVYGFGKSSQGELREITTLQLDPYYLAPLGIDQVSLAALQASAYLEGSGRTERDLAEVAARSRRDAAANPNAVPAEPLTADEILAQAPVAGPLRPADCAPITDGAAAIVLAAGDTARRLRRRPAWIRGIDHRIETHYPGARDLARSESAALAALGAGGIHQPGVAGGGGAQPDLAELHAQFSHEELILRDALGLGDGVAVNPSGGPLGANPVMATGLIRIGEAAARIFDGSAGRVIAHASSGPCLQHNLVCVLESET